MEKKNNIYSNIFFVDGFTDAYGGGGIGLA